MKRILILIIGLFGVAQAQFAPTSAKTAFKNGVSVGTRDSTAYNAADSLVVVINRQGRLMYRSTDGYWKLLANAASSDYVPYTGAVDNVNLGNYRLTARSIKTDSIYANSSAGMYLTTNTGTAVAHWGAGGSVEVDFKGFAGYDANRASSYMARSFTDKNYVDSSAALRVRYTDTAAMLADYVDLSSTQTVNGIKNFSNDIAVNGYTIGRGANSNSGNLAIGSLTLTATTVGSLPNIAIGNSALRNITTGASNVAVGINIMTGSTVGSGNTNVGQNSFADVTSGGNNTSLGNIAGRFTAGSASVTSIDNSTYIGANTRPSATTGVTNETVLGYLTSGNGSNTVTIGNSSVTGTFLQGRVRLADQSISDSSRQLYQQMATTDYWQIFGKDSSADRGEMVFKVGDNGASFRNGGQRFRFYYDTTGGGGVTADRSPLIIDYDTIFSPNAIVAAGGLFNSYSAQYNAGIGTGSLGVGKWLTQPESSTVTRTYFTGSDGSTNGTWEIYRSTSTTPSLVHRYNGDGTQTILSLGTGTVYSNSGTLTNTDPSDSSIKNTINPHKYGLAEILKLQPKSFYYNSDSAKSSLKYGFIAQEVEKIMPDMVRKIYPKSDSSKLGLESQGIYVTMVKAIQEQQAIIEALLTRIQKLEAKLN